MHPVATDSHDFELLTQPQMTTYDTVQTCYSVRVLYNSVVSDHRPTDAPGFDDQCGFGLIACLHVLVLGISSGGQIPTALSSGRHSHLPSGSGLWERMRLS